MSNQEHEQEFDLDKKIRWRKTGSGSFRMANGRIIKPGQVFVASLREIPKAFRDTIVNMDELPPEKPIEHAESKYEARHMGSGWWNVYDAQGKKVNEKALRMPEARALVERLQQ